MPLDTISSSPSGGSVLTPLPSIMNNETDGVWSNFVDDDFWDNFAERIEWGGEEYEHDGVELAAA